jgi:SAM-dependent methyltransferase
LASCYLTRCGFDVTSLEPGGPGFDWHASIGVDVMEALDAEHEHLSIPAERLEPSEHGPFDVIFSNNVLEHVPDPRSVLARLGGLLADGGITVHGCPNYFVPYEPHFGIPLVPARPQLTARLLPARVRESGLWRSLNFIRAADISAAAAGRGFGVQFRSGVLADSVERLSVDPEFRSRHRVLGAATPIVRRIGITKLLTRIPATWATPMEFALWRGPGTTSSRLEAWNERIAI